jgi:hypothetical protein
MLRGAVVAVAFAVMVFIAQDYLTLLQKTGQPPVVTD